MSYKTICSICGGDKTTKECACPLTQQDLEDLTNMSITMNIWQIKDLKEKMNILNIAAIFNIDDSLVRMKKVSLMEVGIDFSI